MTKSQSRSREPKKQTPSWDLGVLLDDIGHGFRQTGQDLTRSAALYLLLLLIVVWIMAGAYLVLVSRTILAAREIQDMRAELMDLHRENAVLEMQIAAKQSPDVLHSQAQRQGFGAATQLDCVEP